MIIEFTVENFRSIKEPQKLSFVASNYDHEHPENLIEVNAPGLKDIKVVKSAILYGPNASGKTNILHAMSFMIDAVRDSFKVGPSASFRAKPFKLDDKYVTKPSRLEIVFVLDNIRYEYGFSASVDKVHEEWLRSFRPKIQEHLIFFRKDHEGNSKYEYGFSFEEDRIIEEKTRNNALFLSTAAALNHPELTRIFKFITEYDVMIDSSQADIELRFEKLSSLSSEFLNTIARMLKDADLGIASLEVKPFDVSLFLEALPELEKKEEIITDGNLLELTKKAKIIGEYIKFFNLKPVFIFFGHKSSDKEREVIFTSEEESHGTLRYLSLLNSWLTALKEGRFLAVDEIDRSLHPMLTRGLIEIYQDQKSNENGAQLLLTTHDTSLLDINLFRRDQIWFTEKNAQGATELYPLSDFKPRKDEALERGYLAGRYGAIPILGANLGLDD